MHNTPPTNKEIAHGTMISSLLLVVHMDTSVVEIAHTMATIASACTAHSELEM
jgi:hypothetical protein